MPKPLLSDPLVQAAIGSLVRKGILLLFAYFGFERVLTAPEHAALAEWLQGAVMIGLGLAITQAWAWLADSKLLSLSPPPSKE